MTAQPGRHRAQAREPNWLARQAAHAEQVQAARMLLKQLAVGYPVLREINALLDAVLPKSAPAALAAAEARAEEAQTTHWDGCYTRHLECALARLAQAEARVAHLREALECMRLGAEAALRAAGPQEGQHGK